MATPKASIQDLHYRVIRYFSQSIFRRNTLEDILWDIASNCIRELGFEDCVVYLADHDRKVLVQKAAYGPKNIGNVEIATPIEIPFGKGISGNVALSGIAEVVDDVARDSRYIIDDVQRASEIAVPIIYEDQVLGVIDSEHSSKAFYTQDHIDILQSIASICSSKIAHLAAEEEVKDLARFFEENPAPVLRISWDGKLLQHNRASESLLKAWDIKGQFEEDSFVMERVSQSLKEGNNSSVQTTVDGRTYTLLFAPVQERRYCNLFVNDVSEIEVAKQEAEAANIAKDEFLSIVSHEMRTPVNAIIGIAGLLKDSSLSNEQLNHLKNLDFSSKSLLNLINDVLDFAKIQADKVTLEKRSFNLRELIQATIAAFENKASKQGIELRSEIQTEVPDVIVGDELRLLQILNNLLNNAMKFTEKGQVLCKVSEISRNAAVSTIRFEIADTGIGISDEAIQRIFAPFEQANTSTTRRFGGTGLGLSICRELVHLHGGELGVESIPGKGTSFAFEIAFTIPQFVVRQEAEMQPGNDLTGKTFLVVDDNEINRIICEEFLKRWGATTVSADNGLSAIERFEQTSVDLILMDLQMPECDGLEATRRIRAISSGDSDSPEYVPVVLVTADVLFQGKDGAQMEGIDAFITKPFNPNELYTKVKELLDPKS